MLHKILLLVFFCTNLISIELQKAKTYKENININGWYMSEKLDGIRAYWDGKVLKTKNGNTITTPKGFLVNFPRFELDGELWTKREDFENIQSIVLDKKASKQWNQITYNIFEGPNTKGDFIQRINKAKNWFEKYPNKNVKFIKQIKCENTQHLNNFLEKLVNLKAEGVIIKNGDLAYFKGRNSNILKVKKFFDMEGVVIGINWTKEKMKSLIIQLKNKKTFNLGGGFSNKQRSNPPIIGEIITFKYYGFTKYGKPKFASFLRIRKKE